MKEKWIVGIVSVAALLLFVDIVEFLDEDFRFYEEFNVSYYSTIIISEEKELLFLATENYVYAFDFDLTCLWRYTTRGWIYWIQPLKNGQILLFAQEEQTYFAQIIDAGILVREIDMEFIGSISYEILDSIVVNDIDGDESEEIVIGTKEGYVYLLDEKGEIVWKIDVESPVTMLKTIGTDKDNVLEMAVSAKDLIIISAHGGVEQRVDLPSSLVDFTVVVNKDQPMEIALLYNGEERGYITLIDKFGHQLWTFNSDKWDFFTAVISFDLDLSDFPEILCTTTDGELYILNRNGELVMHKKYELSYPEKLYIHKINGKIWILMWNGSEMAFINTEDYRAEYTEIWWVNSVFFIDMDKDKDKELLTIQKDGFGIYSSAENFGSFDLLILSARLSKYVIGFLFFVLYSMRSRFTVLSGSVVLLPVLSILFNVKIFSIYVLAFILFLFIFNGQRKSPSGRKTLKRAILPMTIVGLAFSFLHLEDTFFEKTYLNTVVILFLTFYLSDIYKILRDQREHVKILISFFSVISFLGTIYSLDNFFNAFDLMFSYPHQTEMVSGQLGDYGALFMLTAFCILVLFPKATECAGRIEIGKSSTHLSKEISDILSNFSRKKSLLEFAKGLKAFISLILGELRRIQLKKEFKGKTRRIRVIYLYSLFLGIGGIVITYFSFLIMSMLFFGVPKGEKFQRFFSKFEKVKRTLLSERIFLERNQRFVYHIAFTAALFYINARFVQYPVQYIFMSLILADLALNIYFVMKPYRGQRFRYDIYSISIWMVLMVWSLRDISVFPVLEWSHANFYNLYYIYVPELLQDMDFILYIFRFLLIAMILLCVFQVRRRYSELRSRQLRYSGAGYRLKKNHFWKIAVYYFLEGLSLIFLPPFVLGYIVIPVHYEYFVYEIPFTLILIILVGITSSIMSLSDLWEHHCILFD